MIDYDIEYQSLRRKFSISIPNLKNALRESGFFSYYFKHRKRIKKWNLNAHIINFSKMGSKLEVNFEFKEKLDRLFLKNLLKASRYMDIILANGWQMKYLTIWEYNVMVNFKKFFDIYYGLVNSDELRKADFYKLERAYVKINYRSYYANAILTVFEKVLKINNRNYDKQKEKIDTVLQGIKAFIDMDSQAVSLKDLILAYNMCQFRTYFTWGDIFLQSGNEIVQKKFYDCSKNVFKKIVGYYQDINNAINSMEHEKVYLLQLKSNCDYDSINPAILVDFYETLNHDWRVDQGDYHLMFLLTIQGLLKELDRLIFSDWNLVKENETHLRQQLIYNNEIYNLFHSIKKEHQQAYVYFNNEGSSPIPIKEFKEHQTPEVLLKTDNQKKIADCFTNILNSLFELSSLLKGYGDVASRTDYEQYGFLRYMIDSPKEWVGKPVFALFNYYVELCWTICAFFRQKTFRYLDSRLSEMEKNLESMEEEKNRIDTYGIIGKVLTIRSVEMDD